MIEFCLPIYLPSANIQLRTHWAKKSKRKKMLKGVLRLALNGYKIPLPCVIVMTRLSPRMLDDDNLQGAFKEVRDIIAEIITGLPNGRGDSDKRLTWQYRQETAKIKGFRIIISLASTI